MKEVPIFIIHGLVKYTVIGPIILILLQVSPPSLLPQTPQASQGLNFCWRAW